MRVYLLCGCQCGKSIFVRSIDDPASCKQYVGHTAQTTVARFSPSGFYVASGDVSGSVRVWDSLEAVNTKGMAWRGLSQLRTRGSLSDQQDDLKLTDGACQHTLQVNTTSYPVGSTT